MSKVLKADASAGNAYVQFDFAAGAETEVWYSFRLLVPTAAWVAWTTGGGTAMLFGKAASSAENLELNVGQWFTEFNAVGADVDPSQENVWLDCEMHLSSTLLEFFIAGVSVFSLVSTYGSKLHFVLGLRNAPADPSSVVYFDDAKAGTTRGGTDLFSDDFESGDLSAWTDVNGAVSVVNDPLSVPTLIVEEAVGIEAPTFAAVPEGSPLPVTTGSERARVMLAKEDQSLSLRFTLSGQAAKAEIYAVEVEYRADPLTMDGSSE